MSVEPVLIEGAIVVDEGAEQADGWVLFEHGRVAARGRGKPPTVPAGTRRVDGRDRILTPGLVDIHAHGALGATYDDADEDAVDDAVRFHLQHGVTAQMLSLVSAPLPQLIARLHALRAVVRRRDEVLGVHLEGPWLSPGHRGAHALEHLAEPGPKDVDRLLAAADGVLRMITIAPELPGAPEAIARLSRAGVIVAVGHTSADHDVARAAFAAGATVLTHGFNGMLGWHHRTPGPVAAAAAGGAIIEAIADGAHLHPATLRLLQAVAPHRIALVSDATAATGCADGAFQLGGLTVDVVRGVARLRHGGSIAGSTIALDTALRFAVREAGWPLPIAVAAATEVPAAAVGRPDLGSLRPGSRADAVLFDRLLRVRAVWSAGEPVAGAPQA